MKNTIKKNILYLGIDCMREPLPPSPVTKHVSSYLRDRKIGLGVKKKKVAERELEI